MNFEEIFWSCSHCITLIPGHVSVGTPLTAAAHVEGAHQGGPLYAANVQAAPGNLAEPGWQFNRSSSLHILVFVKLYDIYRAYRQRLAEISHKLGPSFKPVIVLVEYYSNTTINRKLKSFLLVSNR